MGESEWERIVEMSVKVRKRGRELCSVHGVKDIENCYLRFKAAASVT